MKRQNNGFGLLEMLAVFAILGLLAFVATPRFMEVRESSEWDSVREVARKIEQRSEKLRRTPF